MERLNSLNQSNHSNGNQEAVFRTPSAQKDKTTTAERKESFVFTPATTPYEVVPPVPRDFTRLKFSISIGSLPLGLPKDPNPRSQNINTKVAKKVRDAAKDPKQGLFDIGNRGLLLIAKSVRLLPDGRLRIHMPIMGDDGIKYGLADGATTRDLLVDLMTNPDVDPAVAAIVQKKFIEVEVVYGADKPAAEYLSAARNTNMQVTEVSLMNNEGYFDFIKTALAPRGWDAKVSFRQNEKAAISVQSIMDMMVMVNPLVIPIERKGGNSVRLCHGTNLYGQNNLVLFSNNLEHIRKMSPKMIRDLLLLHDFILANLADTYNSKGRGKAGNMVELFKAVTPYGETKTPFVDLTAKSVYPIQALLMGVLGSLRCFAVDRNDQVVFNTKREDIEAAILATAPRMVRKAKEYQEKFGNKGDTFARKLPDYWEALFKIMADEG